MFKIRNTALKNAIVKLNIIMFTILIFGLYKHLIIASTMIIIAGLDIILAFSELQIAQREKAKFILVLLIHSVIISEAIIIGAERGLFEVIVFFLIGIVIGEISIIEYQKIKEE